MDWAEEGRDRYSQPLIQQVVNGFRPQFVRDNQTGVAGLVPLTTASGAVPPFSMTRELRRGDFRGAAHIEVKIAAPELLRHRLSPAQI